MASRAILDYALTCLVLVRGGDLRDSGAAISMLVTLISEAEARLPDGLVDDSLRGYTWNRIAGGSAAPSPSHGIASLTTLAAVGSSDSST